MSVYILLSSDIPLEEVPVPPGLVIAREPGKQEAEYRNAGRGFAVSALPWFLEVQTEKEYLFNLAIYGGEEAVAAYLREQLEEAGEIELWHVWLDGDMDHRVRKAELKADELTAEDIRELNALETWREPVIYYCYQITH